jgi:hypothetical protein
MPHVKFRTSVRIDDAERTKWFPVSPIAEAAINIFESGLRAVNFKSVYTRIKIKASGHRCRKYGAHEFDDLFTLPARHFE